jgi:hypothetical protein
VEAEQRIRMTPDAAEGTQPAPERDRAERTAEAPDAVAHERCAHHPSRAAVARCNACEEPVCLACAVPVRGRTVGTECLATELGDPALTVPPDPSPPAAGSSVVLAGAALAVVATIGPWTRTGAGHRILGAWVPSVRWSTFAAVSGIVLLVAAWLLRARGTRIGATVRVVAASVVAAASALAITFPPTFQVASWGPWFGLAGGTIAFVGAIIGLVRERRPTQGI